MARAEQELQQKEEALRQAKRAIQEVVLDRKSQLQALEEEKGRTRIQVKMCEMLWGGSDGILTNVEG